MKPSYLQQPLSPDRRENSNPCNLTLHSCPRYLSQQHFQRQHNTTPRQQGRSTPACFFTKKHQSGPIVERGKQNHGQTNEMTNKSTIQESGPLNYTLLMRNTTKVTVITSPKAKGQTPGISHRLFNSTYTTLRLPNKKRTSQSKSPKRNNKKPPHQQTGTRNKWKSMPWWTLTNRSERQYGKSPTKFDSTPSNRKIRSTKKICHHFRVSSQHRLL
jgi:hypothetical protein